MAECCPHCGRALREEPSLVERLRDWCVRNAHYIAPDDSVYEETAAVILDRSPGTLSNWRAQGHRLRYRRSGRTSRVRYLLADLAAYLEESTIGND